MSTKIETAKCPTCGHLNDIELHLTAALSYALKHVPQDVKDKINGYLDREMDKKLIEMALEYAQND